MSETSKMKTGQVIVERNTEETKIKLELNLNGQGKYEGSCGIGFFDHMLTLFCRHSLFDCSLQMTGDLAVDGHHTIEDLGLVMGQGLREAVGNKEGISRYGTFFAPMDEALIMVSLDLSGRPYLVCNIGSLPNKVGDFDTELVPEFLRALSFAGGVTLHIHKISGTNSHHIVEGIFKALARALRLATALDTREKGVPSSKGIL